MELTVVLALAGCNRKTIYHHYEHTPLTGWEKNDKLYFNVPPMTQRAVVQRYVEMRITGEYPFQGLNIVVEQTVYPSRISRLDTLNCNFTNAEGSIKGKGVSLYQYKSRMSDISLNEGDSLSVSIRHNMKREILPGIADVGVCLTNY